MHAGEWWWKNEGKFFEAGRKVGIAWATVVARPVELQRIERLQANLLEDLKALPDTYMKTGEARLLACCYDYAQLYFRIRPEHDGDLRRASRFWVKLGRKSDLEGIGEDGLFFESRFAIQGFLEGAIQGKESWSN